MEYAESNLDLVGNTPLVRLCGQAAASHGLLVLELNEV